MGGGEIWLILTFSEFDDWEEDEPLLEPKFVWTGPHDSKRMGIFHKSWDSYRLEFRSKHWELGEMISEAGWGLGV